MVLLKELQKVSWKELTMALMKAEKKELTTDQRMELSTAHSKLLAKELKMAVMMGEKTAAMTAVKMARMTVRNNF